MLSNMMNTVDVCIPISTDTTFHTLSLSLSLCVYPPSYFSFSFCPNQLQMRESMLRASMEQQCASGVSLKSSAQKREAKSFEKDQLSAVLAHPQFQADPFAAMKQHIENSIALDKSEAHSQDWRLVTHAQGQGSSAGRKRSARPR
jgi:hypothetical protein